MIAPSICIPRIFDNSITKNEIYKVFHKYNWGPISRIDLISSIGLIIKKIWISKTDCKVVRQLILSMPNLGFGNAA